jgi:hypothetical protein
MGRGSSAAAHIRTEGGVENSSTDMVENGRFLLPSSRGTGGGCVSVDTRLGVGSSASPPAELRFLSMVTILSASSLMYLHLDQLRPRTTVGSITYPLLGPRFCGTRLKRQVADDRRQFVHGWSPASVGASHLIFFLRHSSQARDTLVLLRGGVLSAKEN